MRAEHIQQAFGSGFCFSGRFSYWEENELICWTKGSVCLAVHFFLNPCPRIPPSKPSKPSKQSQHQSASTFVRPYANYSSSHFMPGSTYLQRANIDFSGLIMIITKFNKPQDQWASYGLLFLRGPQSHGEFPPEERDLGADVCRPRHQGPSAGLICQVPALFT